MGGGGGLTRPADRPRPRAPSQNVLAHYMQRHHLITKYIAGSAAAKLSDTINAGQSDFLTAFYKGATL